MTLNRILKIATMTIAMHAATAAAQTPYDEGQKALRESRWMAAANHFEQALDSEQADAAMYWRAHALYRAGHRGDAARQVKELARKFPDSHWNEEARALQIEFGGSMQDAVEEDRLRIFALSQLMQRDLERALPLVIELMRNTESDSVRRDAMFVLGMSESPKAQEIIAEAARNSDDPELQADAIQMLAAAGSDFSLSLLEGLYQSAADERVKMAVIHAYIAGDSPGPLVDILRTETNPELQTEAIHALGAMGATRELNTVWPQLKSTTARRAAIEAFAISGNDQMLEQLLATESDPVLRRAAIEGIAIADGPGAVAAIERLYGQAKTVEEKQTILESMMILDGGAAIAKRVIATEQDPQLLESAIQILGMLGETSELAGLYQSLEKTSTRRIVLESMAIAEDLDGIRAILDAEQEPELRVAAIHSLAINRHAENRPVLLEAYAKGGAREKRAVIEAFIIMEEDQALITLAKNEQSPDLRRALIEAISIMDTEAATDFLFSLIEKES